MHTELRVAAAAAAAAVTTASVGAGVAEVEFELECCCCGPKAVVARETTRGGKAGPYTRAGAGAAEAATAVAAEAEAAQTAGARVGAAHHRGRCGGEGIAGLGGARSGQTKCHKGVKSGGGNYGKRYLPKAAKRRRRGTAK